MLSRSVTQVIVALLCIVAFCTILDGMWKRTNPISRLVPFRSSKGKQPGLEQDGSGMETGTGGKVVVAHFMLGNTYPYTPSDWSTTLHLASQTGLDALVLNLGPEEWQYAQARSAYQTLARMDTGMRLFLSLDMNVLPSATEEDLGRLVGFVLELGRSGGQFRTRRRHLPGSGVWGEEEEGTEGREKIVLSTFGGGEVSFGGKGWEGFLKECESRGSEIYFIPSFFLPPEKILSMSHVDAAFNWNAAWPMGNHTVQTKEDQPFLKHRKPYMAAVSPWFFTHYGTTGDWAWNKNWIYRSDDNLYATRWMDILDENFDPEFVQIISWNDYGESHYIGPVMGAQPGSERWTEGMPHEAWRRMTEWFIRRYKGVPLAEETETSLYLGYRLQPKDWVVDVDEIGKPDRAGFAQDVISVVVTLPGDYDRHQDLFLLLNPGERQQLKVDLLPKRGIALATVPLPIKEVNFALHMGDRVVLEGKGEPVLSDSRDATLYNFNAWTGVWSV